MPPKPPATEANDGVDVWLMLRDARTLVDAGVTYWQAYRHQDALVGELRVVKRYGVWLIHRDDVPKLKATIEKLRERIKLGRNR